MIEFRTYEGDRRQLMPLLLVADEPEPLAKYVDTGEIVVAVDGDEVVSLVVLTEVDDETIEAKNVAVLPSRHRQGIGRALMHEVIERARAAGKRRMVVCTVTADTDNVRFYQVVGFRPLAIERDKFTPENGYAPDSINGIEMRDAVWFDIEL